MAQLIITFWRDIPAQVTVKAGRKSAKRVLPERFEKAIDAAAMRGGMASTDDYLSEWRKAEPQELDAEQSSDLEAAAEAAAQTLDQDYSAERLRALIANEGRL
jgi:hypothetical protein